jgi:predicted enzyme related to lactoylglutathione lyase
MKPFDIPNVGRIAMITDPQGNPLYVMRGSVEAMSTVFERGGMGKCNWNELMTSDPVAGNAFYAKVFGWQFPDKLDMPGGGEYRFVDVAGSGTRIGATMKAPPGAKTGWSFYFRVPDIRAGIDKVNARGGKVLQGPMTVPGGDQVIVAVDPEGVPFGLAAPGV